VCHHLQHVLIGNAASFLKACLCKFTQAWVVFTCCHPAVQILKVRPDIGAIVVKGAVPGKAGNVLEITPAKIVGKNIGPQVAKKAAA